MLEIGNAGICASAVAVLAYSFYLDLDILYRVEGLVLVFLSGKTKALFWYKLN